MSSNHKKKLVAPIFIVVLMCLYYVGIGFLFAVLPMLLIIKIMLLVIPIGFVGVSIFVLVERIQEIRSGEEDDLSKY